MTTQTKPEEAAAAAAGEAFLSVRDLKVHFSTEDGIVKAVDGLSFDLERGRTLGIVGESGSGKSVTNLAVLGLHNRKKTAIDGSITLDGQELTTASEKQLETLRGKKMAMIFQDALTALSPYYTIGRQIGEPFMKHTGASSGTPGCAPSTFWRRSASHTRSSGSTTTRTSSPAVCASAR